VWDTEGALGGGRGGGVRAGSRGCQGRCKGRNKALGTNLQSREKKRDRDEGKGGERFWRVVVSCGQKREKTEKIAGADGRGSQAGPVRRRKERGEGGGGLKRGGGGGISGRSVDKENKRAWRR